MIFFEMPFEKYFSTKVIYKISRWQCFFSEKFIEIVAAGYQVFPLKSFCSY